MSSTPDTEAIIAATRRWLETVVIDLNLCPFAGRELHQQRIRFVVSASTTAQQLLESLQTEVAWLDDHTETETTLLIHPAVLQEFNDYNQFLESADDLLEAMGAIGTYQVASFHPHYQFAGTEVDDVENYTNRSPFPMLHLLREQSLEGAIASHPDTALIPQRNIALMNQLGIEKLKRLLGE